MERPGARARTHDAQHLTALDTLVRTRRGFVVFDPRIVDGTSWSIDDHGTLVDDRVPVGATLAVVGAAGVAGAVAFGDGWWRLSSFVGGVLVGAVLAALLLWLLNLVAGPERRYRALTGSRVYSRTVTDTTDPDTWRLCVLAARVAGSRAFRLGLVDRERCLGALLWAAGGPEPTVDPRAARDVLSELAEVAGELDLVGAGTDPVVDGPRVEPPPEVDPERAVALRGRAALLSERLRCA